MHEPGMLEKEPAGNLLDEIVAPVSAETSYIDLAREWLKDNRSIAIDGAIFFEEISLEQAEHYYDSLGRVISEVDSQDREGEGDMNSYLRKVLYFTDPYAIHLFASEISSWNRDHGVYIAERLLESNRGEQFLISLDYELMDAFKRGNRLIENFKMSMDRAVHFNVSDLAENMADQADIASYLEDFEYALETIIRFDMGDCEKMMLVSFIQSAKQPAAVVEAWGIINDNSDFYYLNPDLIGSIYARTSSASNPIEQVLNFSRVIKKLKDLGIDLSKVNRDMFQEAVQVITDFSDGPELVDALKQSMPYSYRGSLKEMYVQSFEKFYQQASEDNLDAKIVCIKARQDLTGKLQDLGIPLKIAEEIFASWDTYDQLERKPGLHKRQIIKAADIHAGWMSDQWQAISDYKEAYGIDELLDVINTFGIYNFIRIYKAVLHEQWKEWSAGQVPVKNLIIVARSDHNNALQNAAKGESRSFFENKSGLFYFEAGSGKELDKIGRLVRARETSNGRKPDLDYILINCHANDSFLTLSEYEGGQIEAEAYEEISSKHERAGDHFRFRTYKEYFGDNFELLLKGCYVRRVRQAGDNIASTLEKRHKIKKVHGAALRTQGAPKWQNGKIYLTVVQPNGETKLAPSLTEG